MNNFADALLSLLFGWMRTLVEGIWSSFSSGKMRNTISWLGDHWLWLVLMLCIACTVLDYFVWFIRWKPYVIWRNKLRRLLGKRETSQEDAERIDFRYGYDQGVEMDLADLAPAPPPVQPEPEEWHQPLYEPTIVMPAVAPAPVCEPPLEEPLYPDPVPMYLPEQPVVRNRRSQRYEKKKFRLSGILPTANEENEQMLDGLPPAVDKSEAFHAPVYPGQYNNQ